MPFQVKVTVPPNPGYRLDAALQRGLQAAGEEILAVSDVLAPREPEPRHGIHMTETGYVRSHPQVDGASVEIGYTAFWAVWQHEDLAYHHPHGGQAKFLATAIVRSPEAVQEQVAASVRAEFGA